MTIAYHVNLISRAFDLDRKQTAMVLKVSRQTFYDWLKHDDIERLKSKTYERLKDLSRLADLWIDLERSYPINDKFVIYKRTLFHHLCKDELVGQNWILAQHRNLVNVSHQMTMLNSQSKDLTSFFAELIDV